MAAATPHSGEPSPESRVATGIEGLDKILMGGFTPHRLYLIEGMPGTGKTTVAMQFLLEGARRGESVLYLTLSETKDEMSAVAASHGWSLDGIHLREFMPSTDNLHSEHYTVFHPSEVELGQTTEAILADVGRLKPTRVVFDSLSELRLLAGNALRYRRQILALKQYFAGKHCTVMLLDDLTSGDRDLQVQSIAHGVVLLEHMNPEYGAERRRLRVTKFRGSRFRGGYHDFNIVRGGLEVFPRLVAADSRKTSERVKMTSGIEKLDTLLGGGLEQGTSTLIAGPAGSGKSTLAVRFALAAAERGQSAALFIFDENPTTLLARATSLGMDLTPHLTTGRIKIQQVDPAELSPGEFVHAIRKAVELDRAALIVIDSLNGYLQAMPEERFLIIQLHELLSYLAQEGAATLLISAHKGLLGGPMQGPVDASYLADTVILMRYFEAGGELHQAMSIVKKRGGSHGRGIHRFRVGKNGIEMGEPLKNFRGILTNAQAFDSEWTDP